MKVKVLEAMAYGVPTVTTTEGIAGIEAVDGRHVGIADDDEVFAEKVVALLRNEVARRTMRLTARQLVEQRYSPRPVLRELHTLYEEIVR
jgi:glycosyltransferase involved in cell wall biosynthesis